jgi:hypothetical protein
LLGVERRFRGSVQQLGSLGQISSSLAQHVSTVVGVSVGGGDHRGSRDGTRGHAEGETPPTGRANGWLVAAVIHENSDLS